MSLDLQTRAELQDLALLYADAVCRDDQEQFKACFANEGVWDVSAANPDWCATGHDAILQQYLILSRAHNWVVQAVHSTLVLDSTGKTARTRTYVSEYGNLRDNGIFLFALYTDECIREKGRWVFANRKFDPIYHGTPDLMQAVKVHPAPTR